MMYQDLIDSAVAERIPPYSALEARLYDVHQAFDADLDFYQNLCQKYPGPVLELGVGTGRVALHLASCGVHMTGVDREKDMLDRLREKPLAQKLHLIEGDVMHAPLPKEQRILLMTLNFFLHLESREDKKALLERLHTFVADDGLLVIDVDTMECLASLSGVPRVMVTETLESDDPILMVLESYMDRESGIDYNESLLVPLVNKEQKPMVSSWQWHVEENIPALLKECHWDLLEHYGGYHSESVSVEHSNQIFICKKGS